MKLAYRKLKELEALKSDIISNVSHELKTPIAIIGSILDLLADDNEKHTKVELI
ncbi:MAG: histidine kinase dimerization/phospho-acceptor domain-containing protein [Candidatus Hydrothermarchaeaceae archaeon]